MKTPHTVFQDRKFKHSRILFVLLIAAALILVDVVPGNAGGSSITPQTEVVLDQATAPVLQGTFQTIGKTPGNQGRPSTSGNIVSYTDFDDEFLLGRIRYFDLATNTDHLVPGPEANNYSNYSHVSGHRIVFQEITPNHADSVIYDTLSQTRTIIPVTAPLVPDIGGNLVVYQITSQTPEGANKYELHTFDVTTGATTQLTDDDDFDGTTNVSPTGNAVVWNKCPLPIVQCDIYSAVQTAPGVFTTTALAASGLNERDPITNGETVVYVKYDLNLTEPSDVYFQPVTGGEETRLVIPSYQHRPRIAGNLIAFESLEPVPGTSFFQEDIFVYDITTQTLSRVTNTPISEFIGDFTIADGNARIVFQGLSNPDSENASWDIFAFTFPVPDAIEDQINDLIELVESFGLPRGPENSLTTKLEEALAAIAAGDTATACSSLTAFINESSAQSGKKLTADQAAQLITPAQEIKLDLGSQ